MASVATPEAGFADGDGDYARFDGPSGLAAAEDGTLFVADTNNHLVRNEQSTNPYLISAGFMNRVHSISVVRQAEGCGVSTPCGRNNQS